MHKPQTQPLGMQLSCFIWIKMISHIWSHIWSGDQKRGDKNNITFVSRMMWEITRTNFILLSFDKEVKLLNLCKVKFCFVEILFFSFSEETSISSLFIPVFWRKVGVFKISSKNIVWLSNCIRYFKMYYKSE